MLSFFYRKKNKVRDIEAKVRAAFSSEYNRNGYKADAFQTQAIEQLSIWSGVFLAGSGRKRSALSGFYLWGGVGRGKSFIMDTFFQAAPTERKRRLHFHALLQELQKGIASCKLSDPMRVLARDVSSQVRLFCVDEFHAHDIGDAVLLMRFVELLVEEGVGLVLTSNYAPEALCRDPFRKKHFEGALDIIHRKFEVISVDAGVDYRRESSGRGTWGQYVFPTPRSEEAYVSGLFNICSAQVSRDPIKVNHRDVRVMLSAGKSVWFDFQDLFETPRSSADYLWIVQHYERIALSGLCPMAVLSPDVRQRFLSFIDVAYDQKIYLVLITDHSLDDLCRAEHDDFNRMYSRLSQLTRLQEN